MFPQAGSPTVTACRDRLGETPSLQSHRQLPAQLPSCTEPSATKVLFQPDKSSLGSDITYIPTREGWLYPSIVKDLCARKIVGYACSERTGASLTPEALHLAVRRCKPPKGFVFHSDRASSTPLGPSGSALTAEHVPKGAPCDNAVAENFFSCLKCELIHLKLYPIRASAQAYVFAYPEAFFNSVRPHSALGWQSPRQFEPPSTASVSVNEPLPKCQRFILLFPGVSCPFFFIAGKRAMFRAPVRPMSSRPSSQLVTGNESGYGFTPFQQR